MTIDYYLVVSELKQDLERLAEKNRKFISKTSEGLSVSLKSELKLRHRGYMDALNHVLMATSRRYHVKYEPIPE